MTLLLAYYLCATLMFIYMAVFLHTKTFVNIAVKAVSFVFAVWGIVIICGILIA